MSFTGQRHFHQYEGGCDGIARTTNSVEGWHYGLQSLFQCHHPTLWTLLDGLNKDLHKQKATFLQCVTGLRHPSSKKYRRLQERLQTAVQGFGRSDILTYVRGIAHMSHA